MRGKRAQVAQVGERTNPAGKPVGNKILLSISDDEYRRIRPHLEFVDLPHHLSLHEPREKLEFVYFPNRGLVSLVVATQEGREVEAGVVGCEGVVGTALAVGLYRSPLREVVQIEGNGFRISALALQATLQAAPELQMSLSRYAVLQGMQVAQTAACNRLHELVQRLARWLLMAQDRVDTGTLPLTHDFLATMLGTDRSSVSLAAEALQKNKQIRYRRGAVEIVNRKRLETSACECYQVIQQLNGQLGLK
ncbi:MAG: Crp/Fnr family transcriptional regulator [Terriglobia bacterium]